MRFRTKDYLLSIILLVLLVGNMSRFESRLESNLANVQVINAILSSENPKTLQLVKSRLEMLETKPGVSSNMLIALGKARIELGNSRDAAVVLQKAIYEFGIDRPYLHLWLADVYHDSSQATAAIREYQWLLEYLPDEKYSRYVRWRIADRLQLNRYLDRLQAIEALMRVGNLIEAKRWLLESREIYPNDLFLTYYQMQIEGSWKENTSALRQYHFPIDKRLWDRLPPIITELYARRIWSSRDVSNLLDFLDWQGESELIHSVLQEPALGTVVWEPVHSFRLADYALESSGNLIPNGDFEEGEARPYFWRWHSWAGGEYQRAFFFGGWDKERACSGSRSIRIHSFWIARQDPGGGARAGFRVEGLQLEAGQKYVVRLCYMTHGGRAVVSIAGSQGIVLHESLPQSEGAWREWHANIGIERDESVNLYLLNFGEGDVWFDAVSMTGLLR